MAEPICEDEGLLQEWTPLTQLLQKIPLKVQKGLFSHNLSLTCLDVISEYIALGTNSNIVYWYSRCNGELQRLRLENSHSEVTCVKVVSSVDYMVAAGTNQGTVIVFQIPKLVPESIPDQLKPKKKQIERFTINGLHNGSITNIEWSQNGMKLFSGDKNGLVVLTEIDFALHLTKSVELINEQFEIVQLSYKQQLLLVSTVYRSIVCDGSNNWKVHQVGTKERKILGKFGAVLCKFDHGLVLYACRPGYRLWLADRTGVVQQTLIFKSAIQSTCPKIQVINPVVKKQPFDTNFGKVLHYGDNKLIAYNSEVMYVLHPGAVSVTSVLCNVRKILDLAVNDNEIFILEGERSLLRLCPIPDKYSEEMGNMSSRRSAFNLDEFAAKIKDTAVGSIKKITKDFITIPDQNSPNSPPALADDALQLPPIVYLPDGTIPPIQSEQVEIDSPQHNDNDIFFTGSMRHNGHGDESSISNSKLNNDYPEEIITRPLRKKRNKLPKKSVLPPQVLESESDTTSNASDDRLTWGVANDLSLSDESAMSQSHSSFSVLRDISALMNQQGDKSPSVKLREIAVEEIMTVSDCKSQTSLDTCESVSECLMTSSERFREEQEKTFARLANLSYLDNCNSEKTDNMSISLNTGNSSSITSDNMRSPSEYSENASSLTSRTKTTESQTYDNYTNDQRSTPMDLNDGPSDNQEGMSDDEKAEESAESSKSIRNSIIEHRPYEEEANLELKNLAEAGDESKTCTKDVGNENCSINFGIKKLSEFFSQEGQNDVEEYYDNYLTKDKINDQSCSQLNGKDGHSKDHSNANYPVEQPMSYGPPSGSSLTSFMPDLMDQTTLLAPGSRRESNVKISEFTDHWLQYKIPDPVTSLSVSRTYVMCTDINDRVYYSHLSGLGLNWVLLDYKASAVRVSYDGSAVWLMDKKSVYSLINPSPKGPFASDMEKIASDVLSFAVDHKNNDGWIVTSHGKVLRFPVLRGKGSQPEEIACPYLVIDIACSDGMVLVLTVNEFLLCKQSNQSVFQRVPTPKPTTTFFTLGPDNLLWVIDDKGQIYFSDDFASENPKWWQIQISDYIFHNSAVPFQNIYSKIKLNNLKPNCQSKGNPCIVASNENSLWICEKFSTTVRVNKSDFTGYKWNTAFTDRSLSTIKWMNLTGEGVFEDKGQVWLLATNGDIFCTSPTSNRCQNIPVPCEDEVLCLASSSDTLWVLSESGSIYSRLGLSDGNLTGNSWRELKLPQIDNLRLIWVSCGCDVAWGCDIHGRTFMTIGSPHHMATNIFDAAWLEVEGRPKGVRFVKVFVGPQMYMVWAIDVKGNLYVREGIFSHYQIGTSWVYVGGIEAVHVSISGTSVWALTTSGTVYRRCGISERNYIGDYWKMIPGTFKMITSSFTDDLWGITHGNEIMRLSYRVKILDKGKQIERNNTGADTSKEDVSWEIIE